MAGIRPNIREKGGFRIREDARRYYHQQVVPAVASGYATPDEYEAALEEAKRTQDESRRKVGQFFEDLIEKKPPHIKRSSHQNNVAVFKLVIKQLGPDTYLDTVDIDDIEALIATPTRLNRDPSCDTVRKRLFALRSAFDRAIARSYVAENPCKDVDVPKPGKGRLRYLTEPECQELLKACRGYMARNGNEPDGMWLYTFVLVAIYTGARLDELNHLEWTDVSWKAQVIHIQNKAQYNWTTKSGLSRPLGVNSVVLEALDSFRKSRLLHYNSLQAELTGLIRWSQASDDERKCIPRPAILDAYDRQPGVDKLIRDREAVIRSLELQIKSPLVFPNHVGQPRSEVPRSYWDVLETTGLKSTGANFHTLRHTYASLLAQAGVDMPTLKELLGHQSIVTTMVYAHLAPDHISQKGALMPTLMPQTDGKGDRDDG
jgi:integrase